MRSQFAILGSLWIALVTGRAVGAEGEGERRFGEFVVVRRHGYVAELALDRPASELLHDPNLNRLFLGGHVPAKVSSG